MKVADLMQQKVRTVAANATMTDAIRSLVVARVSALPVLDERERPIGVLTTKDILRAEAERDTSGGRRWLFDSTAAREVMSPWPPPIAPEADAREAAQMMLYLDLQRLFVIEAGSVVGVISQTDIVDAVGSARI